MPLLGGTSELDMSDCKCQVDLTSDCKCQADLDVILLLVTRCLYWEVTSEQCTCLTVICLLNWAMENWTGNVSRLIFVFSLFLLLFIYNCASTITNEQQNYTVTTTITTTTTKRSIYINCSIFKLISRLIFLFSLLLLFNFVVVVHL